MSKSNQKLGITARDYIFRNLFWMLIATSLGIFLWANYCAHEESRYILTQAGVAILSSGVFAAALKSRQFTGLFKDEIEKLILGSEFIKNRKDLPDLWKAISKSIYREKFPNISNELERIILTNYFPTELDFYYENFHVYIEIKEITDDFVVKYVQTSKYSVILSQECTKTELIHTQEMDVSKQNQVVNKLMFFRGDGVEQNVERAIDLMLDVTTYSMKVQLEGKVKYKVHSEYYREFSILDGNFLKFCMSYITKGMIVSVNYPEDVRVTFVGIGVPDPFKDHFTKPKNRLSQIHEDSVILPHQGFGLSFHKIENG